ncbi:hypothetical protein PIIN_02627 [Serendipita indica DSM 11827]|uniref:Uncharacterized protein n=1 Tax=Serendipita indica (strain DSM 11827) TaxID=1109443 RepID=G4TBS2_SERID|nr:hypothetical protein PIIN_02627 [Serendipita indica DSM 11827]
MISDIPMKNSMRCDDTVIPATSFARPDRPVLPIISRRGKPVETGAPPIHLNETSTWLYQLNVLDSPPVSTSSHARLVPSPEPLRSFVEDMTPTAFRFLTSECKAHM